MSIARVFYVDGSMKVFKDGIRPTLFKSDTKIIPIGSKKSLTTVFFSVVDEDTETVSLNHTREYNKEDANVILLIVPNIIYMTIKRDFYERYVITSNYHRGAIIYEGDIVSLYSIESMDTMRLQVIRSDGILNLKEIPSI